MSSPWAWGCWSPRGGATPTRLWFAAGALSDAVDTVVLTTALRRGALGRTAPTRAAAITCTAGAVVAVAVQVRDARGAAR